MLEFVIQSYFFKKDFENKQLGDFSQKVKQLLNKFLWQLDMKNETILVKLHKTWQIITKMHLNCLCTAHK